jgi:hypothetical protein
MLKFIAPSGAEVQINVAPWKDAKNLKKTIEREVGSVEGLSLDSDPGIFMAAMLKVDSSDMVDAALWPCLVRCTYNNEKITESTFDKPEARRDYYDIVSACVKENLRPLVESLFSQLETMGLVKKKKAPDTQE